MLEKRRRATGLAALSLTAVGALLGMEGTAFPTSKDPLRSIEGGGWLGDITAPDRVHFALSAHDRESGDFGHLNIRLEGNEGAFWADVTALEIITSNFAAMQGVVRKATGVYEGCTGEPFNATAQDGENSNEADALEGDCEAGPRFAGEVEQGNLQIKGGRIIPQ